MESGWGEVIVSNSHLIHCPAFTPRVRPAVDLSRARWLSGLQRLKEEVSVSPVPRHPLQFIRVHAEPPPGSGLCSGGGREMEKACQAQKGVPADSPS